MTIVIKPTWIMTIAINSVKRGHDVATRLHSAMAGALILARAVDDDSLSREILETVAKALKARGEG